MKSIASMTVREYNDFADHVEQIIREEGCPTFERLKEGTGASYKTLEALGQDDRFIMNVAVLVGSGVARLDKRDWSLELSDPDGELA